MSTKERITITVDPDLLGRIKRLADRMEDSVSAVIERMCEQDIGEYERFVDSLANPVIREVTMKLRTSPKLMRVLAALVQEEFTPELAARAAERVPALRKIGERLQAEKAQQKGHSAKGRLATS